MALTLPKWARLDSASVTTSSANPADAGPYTKTELVNTRDASTHDVTTVDGHKVTVNNSSTTGNHLTGEYDDRSRAYVMGLITEFDRERQAKEDIRANHRNFNRLMTLLFSFLGGLLITYGLYHGWFGAWGPKIGPYSFVVTVGGDILITAYSFLKRY